MSDNQQAPTKSNFTYSYKIVGEMLLLTHRDDNEYIININIFPIDVITRMNFNAVTGMLNLTLLEPFGTIQDTPVFVTDKMGNIVNRTNPDGSPKLDLENKPIEEIRFMIDGTITGFTPPPVADLMVARQLLKIYMKRSTDTAFDSVFEGFKAFEKSKEKIRKAHEQKQKEQASAPDAKTEAPVVNMNTPK